MLRPLLDWKVKRLDPAVDCKVYAVWMGMLIGEVARRAGMKPQTVRYYEAMGLLSPIVRSTSGYRSYDSKTLQELGFIRRAQSLGFSLGDVKQILQVARAGRAPCTRVLAIAESHVAELGERIAQLSTLRKQLKRAVQKWRDGGVPADCASTLCGMIVGSAEMMSSQSVSIRSSSPIRRAIPSREELS